MFPIDIINSISEHSENALISNFLLTCKELWSLRDKVFFFEIKKVKEFCPGMENMKKACVQIGKDVEKYKNLTYLIIDYPIEFGNLPEKLTVLRLPSLPERNILSLPKGLKKLSVRELASLQIPQSLEVLEFRGVVPKLIGPIPDTVTYLRIEEFDERKVAIPSKVKKLYIGCTFGGLSKGTIPDSVEDLHLGWDPFGDYIDHSAPIPLIGEMAHPYMRGYSNENLDLKGVIPNSVKTLKFGSAIMKDLEGVIPSSVTNLTLGGVFYLKVEGFLPEGLESLEFEKKYSHPLPILKNLKCLKIKGDIDLFLHPLTNIYQLRELKMAIGSSLKLLSNNSRILKIQKLELTIYEPNIPIFVPETVEDLTLNFFYLADSRGIFDFDWKKNVFSKIPSKVQKLTIKGNFRLFLDSLIPDGITHLVLGPKYVFPIRKYLPQSVKYLDLYKNYPHCHELKGLLVNYYG